MPFIPHTENNIHDMLSTIGVKDIEQLFDEIPSAIRTDGLKNILPALTEMELNRLMQKRSTQDMVSLSFLGAGAYEHHIPAAIWDIVSRGEFMTAYTPYQAEASQGTLQLLYEYQTMMANLTGMEVSNASLYDGASALGEAILMAVRANKNSSASRILMPTTLHPAYRAVAKTVVQQGIELIELPFSRNGHLDPVTLQDFQGQDITALIIPQPNFFGICEEVDALADWAHANNALVIGVVNPTALALLKEPGKWGKQGADIVCGEAQPLGIPLAGGGPYAGFMCCKQIYVRQMPGRIIGCTVDKEGKRGFSLTLQAREQHIRRGKATSNICTNQGLLVTAATIYMSLLGFTGLQHVAAQCAANTRELLKLLTDIPGVEAIFSRPFFHEAVIRIRDKPINTILEKLAGRGTLGGIALANYFSNLKDCLLICATETKTAEDLKTYATQLKEVLTS